MTNRTTQRDYLPPRWRWYLVSISLVAFLAVLMLTGDSDVAVLASFATGVVVLAGRVRWDLHGRAFFWIYLAIVSAAHLVVVASAAELTLPKPTVVVAPLVIVDYVLVLGGLFGLEWLAKPFRR